MLSADSIEVAGLMHESSQSYVDEPHGILEKLNEMKMVREAGREAVKVVLLRLEDHTRKGSFPKYDQAQRRPTTNSNKERATGASSSIRTIPVEAPSYDIAFRLKQKAPDANARA